MVRIMLGLCFWTGTSPGKIMAACTILYYTASVHTSQWEFLGFIQMCSYSKLCLWQNHGKVHSGRNGDQQQTGFRKTYSTDWKSVKVFLKRLQQMWMPGASNCNGLFKKCKAGSMHWLLIGFWDMGSALKSRGRWTWPCRVRFKWIKFLWTWTHGRIVHNKI